jgi:hypothetical protein
VDTPCSDGIQGGPPLSWNQGSGDVTEGRGGRGTLLRIVFDGEESSPRQGVIAVAFRQISVSLMSGEIDLVKIKLLARATEVTRRLREIGRKPQRPHDARSRSKLG